MILIMFPEDPSILSPVKVIGILYLVTLSCLQHFLEQVPLMYMDSNQCLNLYTLQFIHILQTHSRKLCHYVIDILLFNIKLLQLILLASL